MEIEQTDAMNLKTFAKRNGISLSFLYELMNQGKAPKTFRIGRRRLISSRAGEEWRRELEKQVAA
jgi:predicted DNA-binding transcriptional regulator AlpA